MNEATCSGVEIPTSEDVVCLTADEQERIIRFQEEVLKAVVEGREPREVIDQVCLLAEKLVSNAVASVMLLDDERRVLNVFAAPSIPAKGIARLNGLRPGPHSGSCGNVVYQRQPVFVADTLTCKEWIDLRQLAHDFNLMACWSVPIPGKGANILGTFALSSFEPRSPSEFQKRLLGVGASIVSLVLERRQQAEALPASGEKYRALFDGVPDALIVHADGIIRFANPAVIPLLGVASAEDLIGRPIFDFVHPDYLDPATIRMWETKEKHLFVPMQDIRMLRADGSVFDAETTIRVIEVDGDIVSLAVVRDITGRKAAQAALEQEHLRLQHILQMASDGIHIIDEQGDLLEASHSFYHMLGYENDEGLRLNVADWEARFSPDYVIEHICDWLHVDIPEGAPGNIAPPHVFETLHRRRDGSLFEVEINSKAVEFDGRKYLFASARDITERKRAEGALRESEGRFRDLFSNAPVALSASDRSGRVVLMNREFVALFGYTAEEVATTENWWRLVIPEGDRDQHRRDWENKWSQSADGVSSSPPHEQTVICKDGSRKSVLLKRMHIGDSITLAAVDITEHKRNEAALRDSEERFRATFEQTAVGFMLVSFDGRIEEFNRRLCDIIGYPPEEVRGLTWRDITHPDDLALSDSEARRMDLEKYCGTGSIEKRYIRKDGRPVWVRVNITLRSDENGRPLQFITAVEDINRQKTAEAELRLAASVFAHTREGITITDADGQILSVNPAFTRLTGYRPDEAIGRNPRILQSGRHDREFYKGMWNALQSDGHWSGEVWNRRKNGEIYPEWLEISSVYDDAWTITHFVAVFHDISLMKNQQEALDHLAHHDALTGLPNRVLLADRMRQIIAESKRQPQIFALAYMDLDGFKPVNDRHGHAAGDALLVEVASRIAASLRAGDTVARLGGDEFAILLRGPGGRQEFQSVLERIAARVSEPVTLLDGQNRATVSASIGVTLYPDDNVDPDLLLRHADQAMYQAKRSGKGHTQFYDYDVLDDQREKSQDRLRQALENGELELYYQPKVNMRTGTVTGAEALIRWNHPECGLLLPGQFLPDLLNSDLESLIGEWVIETALEQVEAWRRQGVIIPVSVNIAAPHLLRADFVDQLAKLLSRHPDLPSDMLQLEVLESAALENMTVAARTIDDCRRLGVGFALDDFGTGYSSLAYLKALPAEVLKVDRSFIADMLRAPGDLAIVGGVVGLAEAFGYSVVAEGVETVEQGRMLLRLGCDLAQGFGIAVPMPAGQLPEWITAWQPAAAWTGEQRLPAEDFPLLLAEQRHREWVRQLVAMLSGAATDPPPFSPMNCALGRWIHGVGHSRYGRQGCFDELERKHLRIHELAEELIALVGAGSNDLARERLPELLSLQDTIITSIRRCMVGM